MGKKKKKKKCEICLEHDHKTNECVYVCEDCPKGDECKYWCMVDLCTTFQKIIKRFHNASSYEKMERAREKLEEFEDLLEEVYEWHDDRKGKRHKSCSSKMMVSMLDKACDRLREKFEDEFSESLKMSLVRRVMIG